MRRTRAIWISPCVSLLLLAISSVAYAAPELSIVPQDYDIVLTVPVRGIPNAVDVWSRAGIANAGERARGVTARLVSSSSGYVVLDGNLHFGNVRPTPRSRVVFSRDTFKLRISLPHGQSPRNSLQTVRAIFKSLQWQIGCRNCSQNQAPTADAGADQTVFVSQLVTLDGGKSTDPEGHALTYKWTLVGVPAGSAAALSGATSIKPTFTPDRPGDYVVQLIVNDGAADSAADTALISTANSAPVAHAGADQTSFLGQLVQLDGSGSTDIDGDALTYLWSIVSSPDGSNAAIQNPDSVKPTLRPDVRGDYLVQLEVDDGTTTSAPDTMLLSTLNSQPVANAGPDQTVQIGATALLDGSASNDADHDPLTFQWALTARPTGSAAALKGPTTVNPSILIDKPGTYIAQLVVNDGANDSNPDTVALSTINSRPIAVAGANQALHWGAAVTLNGSGSSDPDGDPLTFTWAILSQPDGSNAQLSDVHVIAPSFTAKGVGVYVVQLVVEDGTLTSEPSTLTVTTSNRPPVAHDDSATVAAGASVAINVLSNDSDPDGDPLHIASVTPPLSGSVSIGAAAVQYTPKAGFTGGDSFTYTVSDGVDTATATVMVNVTGAANRPPVANAGPPLAGYVGDSLTLNGSASIDPDGTTLRYTWSIVSGPAGGATLDPANVVGPHITGTTAGTYVVQLIVSDGTLSSAPATTTVVFASLPTLSIANVQMPEGNSGTGALTFVVTLSAPINRAVTVNYATHDGTATAPSDYVAVSGTLVVPANATAASIPVQIIGDTTVEPDETLTLVLSNSSNATLANTTATGTILNDDAASTSALQMSVANSALSRGDVVTAKIVLPTPLPATDITVNLVSNSPTVANVPLQVIVPAGQPTAFVVVQALQPGSATLTASATGLQPARVSILVADRGFSLAAFSTEMNAAAQMTATVTLRAPAPATGMTLNIASSDPSTMTVSPASLVIAAGQLTGTITLTSLLQGSADVSASAVSGTVGSQTVHIKIAPAAADNTKTSDSLIETARVAGQLTDEQALVYRVYAAYGWPLLPAQYRGRIDVTFDSSIRTDINQRWATLSTAAQTALVPFLMPPIYAGSWGDPDVVNAAAATATTGAQAKASPLRASALRAAIAPAAATPSNPNPCSSIVPPLPGIVAGWAHIDTANFRVWYKTVQTSDRQDYTLAEGATAAGNIAAIAEFVYASEVAVMGRTPLPDTNVACNGGDARIDIYMDRQTGSMKAQTVAYPGGCDQAPGYIWVAPDATLDPVTARDIFAHEFMHLIQLAYTKGVDCNQYGWMDEGSAVWAIEHVYHDDNYEHRFSNAFYFQVEIQGLFGSILGVSTPVDTQSDSNAVGCDGGYCTYPLFQFLATKFGHGVMGRIYAASELFDPIASIDGGLGSGNSLRDVWHDFSLAGLNDWKAGVADDFFKADTDPAGFRTSIFDAKLEDTVVEATLKGGKQLDLSDDLLSAFNSGHPGRRAIYRLSSRMVDIKFTDPAVSFVQLLNPAAGIVGAPAGTGVNNPDLKIWAVMHVNGAWQSPVDWTHTPVATFCRDKKDEQIDELVLIYSNGNIVSRGSDPAAKDWYIDLDAQDDPPNSFLPQLYISNVGCFQWKGTSKVTITDTKGGTQTSNATVTFEVDPNFLGADTANAYWEKYFQPKEGTVTFQGSGIDLGTCTEDIPMVSKALSTTPTVDDGYFYITYSPALNAPLLRHASGGGLSTIPNTTFIQHCPDGTHSIVGDEPVKWLVFDVDFPIVGATASDDGRLLSGSVTGTDPDTGAKTVSEWTLEAQKEN